MFLRSVGVTSEAGEADAFGNGVPRPATLDVLDGALGFATGLPFPVVCLSRAIPRFSSFLQGLDSSDCTDPVRSSCFNF